MCDGYEYSCMNYNPNTETVNFVYNNNLYTPDGKRECTYVRIYVEKRTIMGSVGEHKLGKASNPSQKVLYLSYNDALNTRNACSELGLLAVNLYVGQKVKYYAGVKLEEVNLLSEGKRYKKEIYNPRTKMAGYHCGGWKPAICNVRIKVANNIIVESLGQHICLPYRTGNPVPLYDSYAAAKEKCIDRKNYIKQKTAQKNKNAKQKKRKKVQFKVARDYLISAVRGGFEYYYKSYAPLIKTGVFLYARQEFTSAANAKNQTTRVTLTVVGNIVTNSIGCHTAEACKVVFEPRMLYNSYEEACDARDRVMKKLGLSPKTVWALKFNHGI